ncbi:NUDIX hydrolase [Mycolicibacterium sp.]|uniref:NUDIX hydrolase n=1 Tax=Mycolicibacterium sp. TaxID=2320850 RepID=UPI0028AAE9EC|nr:NUDIX hydrolase [Mycolicibacterium sp.]
MRGDGDGWVVSESGTYHWGVHGAAGLLLRAPWHDGTPAVLLQHRALWSHQGGTWALPGGALDSHEQPREAAVREAHEEAGLAADKIVVHVSVVTASVPGPDGPLWTYTTVVADAVELLETVPNRESSELRWVPEHQVADLPLHPAFASSWDLLRTIATVPPHDCRMDQPHTVVIEETFAWCTPAGVSPPAPR